MAARLTVAQCFGSRASVIFSTREMVAGRNAKQGFPSSLEEVWLAKDLVGDVRSLWPLFLHYFSTSCVALQSFVVSDVALRRVDKGFFGEHLLVVSIQRCQCERAAL